MVSNMHHKVISSRNRTHSLIFRLKKINTAIAKPNSNTCDFQTTFVDEQIDDNMTRDDDGISN